MPGPSEQHTVVLLPLTAKTVSQAWLRCGSDLRLHDVQPPSYLSGGADGDTTSDANVFTIACVRIEAVKYDMGTLPVKARPPKFEPVR